MPQAIQQSYFRGPEGKPLTSKTIGQFFDEIANIYPDNDALIVKHQKIRWTYKTYQVEINKLVTGLLGIGIKKGDRVGIWAPNCYEWALTQFATAKIGAIMVCINPSYRLFELEYALNKVSCKVLISADKFKSSHYLTMLRQLFPELDNSIPGNLELQKCPTLKSIIQLGFEKIPGMFNFSEICSTSGDLDAFKLEELDPHDPINIQFTSGTTGSPKGATLTHYNILNNGKIVGDGMKLTSRDKLCIPVPLYHCFGMVMGNLACITHASAAVYPAPVFDPLSTLQAVSEEKCTALHGVPTMFIAELDHSDFNKFNLSYLRTGIMAGAPCPVEVMNRVIKDMHMEEILIAYGQTETSPVNHMTSASDPIEKRTAFVGQPGPHLEIKIINEKGQIVSIGEQGEICCRGYSVMKEYWNDEERTRETIDHEGWLHSGDLGIADSAGYLQITGRIKDMIIRGGENIYPREIEEFLYTHPDVQDVQVFGIPDVKFGEQICAWIKPRTKAGLTERDIKEFCMGQITHFKIPNIIHFVDEFPMTVTGKIQKFVMKEIMAKNIIT